MAEEAGIKNRMITTGVISLIAVILLIGGIVIFAQNKLGVQTPPPSGENAPIEIEEPAPVTGSMGLRQKGTKTQYETGDTVTLFVYADSKGDEITAYDAVLRYDPSLLEFDQVKSLVDGMDIFETVEEIDDSASEFVLTGIQSLSQESPFVLDNTALAEVSFTVLESGQEILLDLTYERGSTIDSNLMNSRTQDVLNEVVGTTVSVK